MQKMPTAGPGQILRLSVQRSAKSLELRAATSLARLEDSRQERGPGHSRLAELYDWFSEGFDTPDLRDAKAVLDKET